MALENNIPAFPTMEQQEDERISTTAGMTLLDYFAAKAMNALMIRNYQGVHSDLATGLSISAYEQAAAMLQARKKHIK